MMQPLKFQNRYVIALPTLQVIPYLFILILKLIHVSTKVLFDKKGGLATGLFPALQVMKCGLEGVRKGPNWA